MIMKFEDDKTYRIKTYDELKNMCGVYDKGDCLSTEEGYYFYTARMDDIKNRTFKGHMAYKYAYDLNFHEGYYKDEVAEPWMCEEVNGE